MKYHPSHDHCSSTPRPSDHRENGAAWRTATIYKSIYKSYIICHRILHLAISRQDTKLLNLSKINSKDLGINIGGSTPISRQGAAPLFIFSAVVLPRWWCGISRLEPDGLRLVVHHQSMTLTMVLQIAHGPLTGRLSRDPSPFASTYPCCKQYVIAHLHLRETHCLRSFTSSF